MLPTQMLFSDFLRYLISKAIILNYYKEIKQCYSLYIASLVLLVLLVLLYLVLVVLFVSIIIVLY